MVRWLGFILVFGLASRLTGGHIDNSAHIGGAIAGAAIAATWKQGVRYSERAARIAVGACAAVLVACIAVVGWHDRTDRYAVMDLQARDEATNSALNDGRCGDAHQGLRAVERLRAG